MPRQANGATPNYRPVLRNVSDECRRRGGDPCLPAVVLCAAYLLARDGWRGTVDEALRRSGLPGWASEAILGALDESSRNDVAALASSHAIETLRGLALASFDYACERAGRTAIDHATPPCVADLALAVLKPEPGQSVADFGCGWGGFLAASADSGSELHGFDIDLRAAALAALRMCVLGAPCDVECGDMLLVPSGRRFDRCFLQAPFGTRLPALRLDGTPYEDMLSAKGPYGRPTSADWVFVRRVLDAIADGGRAVIVVGSGAAFNHGDASVRRRLVTDGRVEAAIALPDELFFGSVASATMLVLGSGATSVRMVDATDLYVPSRRARDMGPDEVGEVLRRLAQDGPMSRMVGEGDLAERNWSLFPPRYTRREVRLENATPLGELATSIERGAALRADELDALETSKDTGVCYLPVSSVTDGRVGADLPHIASLGKGHERSCLRQGDLVLTKNGGPIRAAVAEIPEGQTVLATGNLYVVRPDASRVDPYFLAAFLASDDGRELVDSLTTGSAIRTLPLRDLRGLEVPVPSMEVQRRVAARYQAALDEIEVCKSRLERARAAAGGAYEEEMGS